MHEEKTKNDNFSTMEGLKTRNWFLRRPIPVWIIFAFGALSLIGALRTMVSDNYMGMVFNGEISPFQAIAFFLYPFLFFLGCVLLFFLRRSAFYIYVTYFIWGFSKILYGTNDPAYLSLAIVVGICIYCWQLMVLGKLK